MPDIYIKRGGLLIPLEYSEPGPTPPEGQEVASALNGRDITRGYVDGLQILQPTDTILQARGPGDYTIYDQVSRDAQVAATLGQRRLALVSREWEVVPGGKRAIDTAASDSLREMLDGVGGRSTETDTAIGTRGGWDQATAGMHWGIYWGFAVSECLWGRDGRQVTLESIVVRNTRRFGWTPSGNLVMLTTAKPLGVDLPPRKFWSFSTGPHDDDRYGLGLAHYLYWPVFFKRHGLQYWMTYLEKYAQPTALGKFPNGTSAAGQTKLLSALQAIRTDSAIIMPEGMDVVLLEAARSGTADYVGLQSAMDQAIAKIILGHAGSSESTPGKLGGESNASEVREDLIKSDADLICESFNRSVGRWLTDWNYPGAAYPRVYRRVEPGEKLDTRAKRERQIFDMGYRPTLAQVIDTYGGEWEPVTPAQPQPSSPAFSDPPPAVAVAETQPEQDLRRLLADIPADQMQDIMAQILGPAFDLLASEGPEYPELPDDKLTRLMDLLMTLAQGLGRAAYAAETANG
jgi:phage gp29-like protein